MNLFKTLRFILDHPFNRGRSVDAILRFFSWQIRSRLTKDVEVEWIEGAKLVARNGMTGATGNIYCGLHEYRDMALVLHMLRPGDLFVDVGANIGSYTLLASGVCGAATVAIEPDSGTAEHLFRNIAANQLDELVDVELTAVGEKAGTISFTSGQDTMNRVAGPDDQQVQTVSLARLDDLLSGVAPTLLKFDVEGYETQALRGAEVVLGRRTLIAAMLETVDPEALAILERHGFKQFGYDPELRKLVQPGQGHDGSNALFVRDVEELTHRLRTSAPRTYRGRAI